MQLLVKEEASSVISMALLPFQEMLYPYVIIFVSICYNHVGWNAGMKSVYYYSVYMYVRME